MKGRGGLRRRPGKARRRRRARQRYPCSGLLAGLATVLVAVLAAPGSAGGAPVTTRTAQISTSLATYVSPNIGVTSPANPSLDVDRDCGFSVPTATGLSLWAFCDTALYSPYRTAQAAAGTACAGRALPCATDVFVPSGTASLTAGPPAAGTAPTLDEAAQPGSKLPYRFLPQVSFTSPQAATCPTWSQGLVDLPPAGQAGGTSDQVLDTFETTCPAPGPDAGDDYTGLALLSVSGSAPETIGSPTASVSADATAAGGWPSWSGSNVVAWLGLFPPVTSLAYTAGQTCSSDGPDGDVDPGGLAFSPVVYQGYLYLYDLVTDDATCSSIGVARVSLVDTDPANPGQEPNYLDPADYEFLTPGGWQSQAGTGIPADTLLHDTVNLLATPSDGTDTVVQGGNLSVEQVGGEFVMLYQQAAAFGTGPALLRTAPTPFGPWSDALTVTPPTVTTPASSSDPGLAIDCADVGTLMPGAEGCRAFNLHAELDTSSTQAALVYSYYQSGAQGDTFDTVCSSTCTTQPVVPGQVELASVPVASLPAAATGTDPVVTGVSPSSGSVAGGDEVTVSGTGLAGATAVDVGGVGATVTADSSDAITAIVPPRASAQTVNITVTTAGGASAPGGADQFTYTAAAPHPFPQGSRLWTFFWTQLTGAPPAGGESVSAFDLLSRNATDSARLAGGGALAAAGCRAALRPRRHAGRLHRGRRAARSTRSRHTRLLRVARVRAWTDRQGAARRPRQHRAGRRCG